MQICYWKSIQKYFLPILSCWLMNSFSFTFMQEECSLLNFPFKLLPVTRALPARRSHILSGSYSSSVKHSHKLHKSKSVTFFLEGIFKCCFNYWRTYVELTIDHTEKCYYAFFSLKLFYVCVCDKRTTWVTYFTLMVQCCYVHDSHLLKYTTQMKLEVKPHI